jgi:hypothetical protein
MRKTEANIRTDGAEGFINRVRSHAKSGETLLPELTLSFEDQVELFSLITP